jgi:hypothetical protein
MKSGRSYLSSLLLTGVPSSSQICGFLLWIFTFSFYFQTKPTQK